MLMCAAERSIRLQKFLKVVERQLKLAWQTEHNCHQRLIPNVGNFLTCKKFQRKPRLPAFAIEYQRIPTLFNFNQPWPADPDVCPNVGKR